MSSRLAGLLLLWLSFASAEEVSFVNVTIIDPAANRASPGMTVAVSGDRIRAVRPSSRFKPPSGSVILDGRGKFLIPGLWDMHVHAHATLEMRDDDPAIPDFFFPYFLANGVTGIRSMYDSLPNMRRMRAAVASGAIPGPRIVTSGPMIDGPGSSWPGAVICETAEEGRQAVRKAKRDGADFIKVYSALSRDVYFAIAGESRKSGVTFAGHVPNSIGVAEASDAGQKSVEHLLGIFLACSSREKDLARPGAFFGTALRESAASFDPAKAAALFAKFVRNGTWQTPTLTVQRSAAYFGDRDFMKDERLALLPALVREYWQFGGGGMNASDDLAARKLHFEREMNLVGEMNRAGVKILAGTDTPNPFVFPGDSLHDELELLVKAGLTPAQALCAATTTPAEYLGKRTSLGSIETGKLADMVLLAANPLASIANTRKIDAVMVAGRLFDKRQLNAMTSAASSTR